jgi:hypothetical protein
MLSKDNGLDLTSRGLTGQLPTLHAGEYTGYLSGVTIDAEEKQWVTVTTSSGTHIEQTDIDVSEIPQGSRVEFTIKPTKGARLGMKGTKYKLFNSQNVPMTAWLTIADVYAFIREHQPVLAGLCISNIQQINTIDS